MTTPRNTRSITKRRVVIARGPNAAALLRKSIQNDGCADCANCALSFLASAMDVDHIRPLAHGGEDVADNVQTLCRPCHKAKTRVDFGFVAPPF
jgi:5-methylcytosine-specific restriction protein A